MSDLLISGQVLARCTLSEVLELFYRTFTADLLLSSHHMGLSRSQRSRDGRTQGNKGKVRSLICIHTYVAYKHTYIHMVLSEWIDLSKSF